MIRWNQSAIELSTYSPRRPDRAIDLRLDHNECPPLPGAPEALEGAGLSSRIASYPSRSSIESQIARRFSLSPDQVLLTSGGDDVIARCCQAVLELGTNAVVPCPTFEMIPRSMRIAGAEVRTVDWFDDRSPVDAILESADADTRLIAVVSPNNPTGNIIERDEIIRLARSTPDALVLIDFAYIEFADEDPTLELLEEPNIVVVRTFSKAFGLAGLRTGYALASDESIEILSRVGSPYPVSELSLQWLEQILNWNGLDDAVARRVERVRTERRRLTELLQQAGAEVSISQANFVFASLAEAQTIVSAFRDAGIAIRSFEDNRSLRITCPADSTRFLRVEDVLRTLATPVETEVLR